MRYGITTAMIFYLSHNYRDFAHAGTKSKGYNERIFQSMGFQNAGLRQTCFRNKVIGFFATLAGVLIAPMRLHADDVLVLQYPLKKYYTFVCRAAHLRDAKVISLIHDLGSFRRKKLTPAEEMNRLSHSDFIIVHNENMRQWIADHGRTEGVGMLMMSDYLAEAEAPNRHAPNGRATVLYAGSLPRKKNSFLYELAERDRGYDLHLCGRGLDEKEIKSSSVYYHGFVNDTELITNEKYNYGLVWDGSSIDACTGNYGDYLRYNNPLKASLYVRCHLPLIVWEKAAIAPLVRKKGIGLCVSSLRNLNEILTAVSPQSYDLMEKNVAAWSNDLKNGNCTRRAMDEALCFVKENA